MNTLNTLDPSYHSILSFILTQGDNHFDESRQINTLAKFGQQIKLYLGNGFPAITTKKIYFKGVVGELIWFLRGDTNIKYLIDNDIDIWNKDAYRYYTKHVSATKEYELMVTEEEDYSLRIYTIEEFANAIKTREVLPLVNSYTLGDLGPVYGKQWRNWDASTIHKPEDIRAIDQIDKLIKGIINNPGDRGHILSAWNIADLDEMALRPCHMVAQFNVNEGLIDCSFYMRSTDIFLGLPFNIASYALLTYIIGYLTDNYPRNLIYFGGNVHLYENHIPAARKQLKRDPNLYKLPKLEIKENAIKLMDQYKIGEISLNEVFEKFTIEDFELKRYNSFPVLPAEMLSPTI